MEITMTSYVRALKEARAKLVERRRALVDGLVTPGPQRSDFNDVQNTIERIDKAIADEMNAPSTPIKVSDNYDRRWVEHGDLHPSQ
jgi:hypothetical protein